MAEPKIEQRLDLAETLRRLNPHPERLAGVRESDSCGGSMGIVLKESVDLSPFDPRSEHYKRMTVE